MLNCCHCNRPVPGTHGYPDTRPPVCDGCSESIRTTRKPLPPALTASDADGTGKPKRRRRVKKAATALSLILAALTLTSCGATWAGSLQVELDPATLLDRRQQIRDTLLDILRAPTPEISRNLQIQGSAPPATSPARPLALASLAQSPIPEIPPARPATE